MTPGSWGLQYLVLSTKERGGRLILVDLARADFPGRSEDSIQHLTEISCSAKIWFQSVLQLPDLADVGTETSPVHVHTGRS